MRPFILIRTPKLKQKEGEGGLNHQLLRGLGLVCVTHSRRKRSGYAPAKVCTATLTVQELSSFKRPASTSKDCRATKEKFQNTGESAYIYTVRAKKKTEHARFVRASTDSGARAIPKCSNSSTQRLSNESFEAAVVLSSVLHRIGIGCGRASRVSRRAASRSACSFESAGTLSAAVSACSGSIDDDATVCCCGRTARRRSEM